MEQKNRRKKNFVLKKPFVVEKSCNFTNSFQTGIKKSILSDMNGFQERLLALISEFERAGRVICESEEVSRLDLDTLRRKMRRLYDFIISAEIEPMVEKVEIIPQSAPEIVQLEEPVQPLEKSPVGEQENKTPIYSDKTAFCENKTAFEQEQNAVLETPEKEVVIQEKEPEEQVKETEPEKQETPVEEEKQEIVVEQLLQPVEIESKINAEVALPKEPAQEEQPPEQEPQKPEEEKHESKSSVLSYLHNNIMRDSEPKSKRETSTLDLFSEKPTSIAEQFENQTRSDLRTAIGVSEKFMFINDLFSGNLKEYTDFINRLNSLTSWEMSKEVIEETKHKRKWASSSLAFTTLEDLIHRRFTK